MVAAASPSPPRFIIETGRNPWNRLTEMGLNSPHVFLPNDHNMEGRSAEGGREQQRGAVYFQCDFSVFWRLVWRRVCTIATGRGDDSTARSVNSVLWPLWSCR